MSAPSNAPAVRGQLLLDMDDPYVYALIKEELQKRTDSWEILEPNPVTRARVPGNEGVVFGPEHDIPCDDEEGYALPDDRSRPCFQWVEYERVNWDGISSGRAATIWYTNRKGLVRKAQLANTIEKHITKCPRAVREPREAAMPVIDSDSSDSEAGAEAQEEAETGAAKKAEAGTSADLSPEAGARADSDPEAVENASAGNDDGSDDSDDDDDDDDNDDDIDSDDDDSDDDDSDEEDEDEEPAVFTGSTGCPLQVHVPETHHFSFRGLDELDELLICDLPEVRALAARSPAENLARGDAWILKPSMTNQGKEVHLIASEDRFVQAMSSDDAADIREWVLQKYVHRPLLIDGGRKFHVRVHVLATGAITVHLVDRLLALFSLRPYDASDAGAADDRVHITNVCYQKGRFVAPPGQEGAAFREEQAVVLLHEAFARWAEEHITAVAAGNDGVSAASGDAASAELPPFLQGSQAAFNFLDRQCRSAAAATAVADAATATPVAVDAAADAAAKGDRARRIGLAALAHVRAQIISVLSELFAAGAEVHDARGCCPSTDAGAGAEAGTAAGAGAAPGCTNKQRRGISLMAEYVPLARCSEMYGIDFMIDERLKVWLLEVNAGPDFGQTGQRLKELVCRPLVQGVVQLALSTAAPAHAVRGDGSAPELITEARGADGQPLADAYAVPRCDAWGLSGAHHFTPVLHLQM